MSERNQTQKVTYYLIPFLSKSGDGHAQTESRSAVAGAREGGMLTGLQLCVKMSSNEVVVTMAQFAVFAKH